MKTFRAFVLKEFRHIFRDKRTLMVLFGMPLAQVLLFGFAITTEIHNADMAVLDQAHDPMSRELRSSFTASGYFKLREVESYKELEDVFQRGEAKIAVVFPPDLYRLHKQGKSTAIQVITDASEPNSASTLVSYASALIMDYSLRDLKVPLQVDTRVTQHYNPLQKSVYLFVPGVITIILMLISAMLTAIAITREKEMGNLEILLVSPLKPAIIILGKVLPYLGLSLLNALLILFVGNFVFGVPVNGSFVLLLGETLLFIITVLSLGVVIGMISSSQQMALMISLMVLMMPTILLSGFVFPVSSMPLPLQLISHIIPAKYFILILKHVMLKGVGIEYVWKETLVLAGMALMFIGIGIRKFKIRLQ